MKNILRKVIGQGKKDSEQTENEKVAMQKCVNDLMMLADERGFQIFAIPRQVEDSRNAVIALGAVWGVQRKP